MVSMTFVSIPLHSQYATCNYTTDQYNTLGQYATNPLARYAAGQCNTTGQYMPAVSMPLIRRPGMPLVNMPLVSVKPFHWG